MATVRFVTDTEPVQSSNPLDVIQANQSFLQFLHEHETDLGDLRFPELSYAPTFWEHLVNANGEEVIELDADHDFNRVSTYEPKYHWLIIDLVEKYESGNPRRVVIDCDYHKREVPKRPTSEEK